MDINNLKKLVYTENLEVFKNGLAPFTFGNVSGIDRNKQIVVIKPSGIPYSTLSVNDMVCVSLEDGKVLDGSMNPSSDTPTHLEIYRSFPECMGVVHTHSEYATAFAQACEQIRCTGTTHADYYFGDIPVSRQLTEEEINDNYEKATGKVIVETFVGQNPMKTPAVLIANHGPFVWGTSPSNAVENALVLEYIAKLEYRRRGINFRPPQMRQLLMEKHYYRKHGKNSYYGQK